MNRQGAKNAKKRTRETNRVRAPMLANALVPTISGNNSLLSSNVAKNFAWRNGRKMNGNRFFLVGEQIRLLDNTPSCSALLQLGNGNRSEPTYQARQDYTQHLSTDAAIVAEVKAIRLDSQQGIGHSRYWLGTQFELLVSGQRADEWQRAQGIGEGSSFRIRKTQCILDAHRWPSFDEHPAP
jgi:hypothetical protein